MTLRDPDVCKCGSASSKVTRRRRGKEGQGMLARRHVCLRCGHRWSSFQSLIDPRKLRLMPVIAARQGD